MQKLTERERKFVLFYCGNATEAAKKAGYSKKTATEIGYENLRKPHVAAAIKERVEKELSPLIKSRRERQLLWSQLANHPDPYISMKASELLGKSEGDFTEKIQHSGGVSVDMGRIKKGGKVLVFNVGTPRPS
jgi:phage terminase small subunit